MRADYDKIATLYDEDEVRKKNVDEHLVECVEKYGTDRCADLSVLDIACGTGNQLIANKHRYPSIEMCGIDRSDGMLEQARRKSQNIKWLQQDMDREGLSIGVGAWDYISCQFAYHHSRNKERFLKNVYTNMRPISNGARSN